MTPQTTSLGAFSVSLAVKDLSASKAFYGKLGFKEVGGNAEQSWLILRNGNTTIGLFQGMFEKNMLTFNPGWDFECSKLDSFDDVREIQSRVKAEGIQPMQEVEGEQEGPGNFIMIDPDGNPILVDQHV